MLHERSWVTDRLLETHERSLEPHGCSLLGHFFTFEIKLLISNHNLTTDRSLETYELSLVTP